MGLTNYINYAMKSLLKNLILEVLQEKKIKKILKQSNFIKRDVGYPAFQIIFHFLYMLVMQKRQIKTLNTIYEALIAKITLSMLAYNLVSYITE